MVSVIGVMLVSLVDRPSWKALGLGMMLPGGGFLLGSNWWLAGANLLLFIGCAFVARLNGNALPALVLWFGGAVWAADHAATAGTCELLQLFGYAYAFQLWPAAQWVVPTLAVTALCAPHILSNKKHNQD